MAVYALEWVIQNWGCPSALGVKFCLMQDERPADSLHQKNTAGPFRAARMPHRRHPRRRLKRKNKWRAIGAAY